MSEATGRAKAGFKDLKKIFGGGQSDVRQFGILFSLIAIIALFQYLTDGLTLSSGNLINLVSQYSYILILAIGMVMVIIAGHIDLSVGSVAAFVGIVVATSMNSWHLPWPLAILFGLVVGVLIGAWQGWWVAYVGVPAFIVTLAGMLIFRGGNQVIGNANTVPVPTGFTTIGAGYLPEIGPNTGYNNLTLLLGLVIAVAVVVKELRARRVQQSMGSEMAPAWVSILKVVVLDAVVVYATMAFGGGRTGTSFPVSGIILGVLVLFYSFVTRNTIFGRHIYAVGGNRLAAELSGVKGQNQQKERVGPHVGGGRPFLLRSDPLLPPTTHSHGLGSAEARTWARCSGLRSVPCSIWVRQLKPSATITVAPVAARTAGRSTRSPAAWDTW